MDSRVPSDSVGIKNRNSPNQIAYVTFSIGLEWLLTQIMLLNCKRFFPKNSALTEALISGKRWS